MCETLGYQVMTLQRVRIMNIRLGSLKEGTWRNIEGEERKELDALLSDSSSLSVKERNEKQREKEEVAYERRKRQQAIRRMKELSGILKRSILAHIMLRTGNHEQSGI